MSDLVLRVAAKAVIINQDGKVLIVREAGYDESTQTGHYGLPGGRLDLGERFEDGLAREAREEVGLEVEPLYPVFVGEWHPTIKGVPHQIIAVFVACKAKTTDVKLSEEHDAYEWIDPTHADDYDMMDPDDQVLKAYADRSGK